MPRLKSSSRSSDGPLVTTSRQVISGAGSPGQQVWTGSFDRSIWSPVRTISCTGAFFTVPGRMAITVLARGSMSMASFRPLAGLGLTQEGQKLADLAQFAGGGARLAAQGDAHGHALDRAEQIGQGRHRRARAVGHQDMLEQHRRAARGQQAGLDLGHFQNGGDRLGDANQFALRFEDVDKFAQGTIGHGSLRMVSV